MAGSKVQGGAIEFHLLYLCIKALWWRLCVHQCSLSSSMRQESSSHGGGGGEGAWKWRGQGIISLGELHLAYCLPCIKTCQRIPFPCVPVTTGLSVKSMSFGSGLEIS